MHHNVMRVQNSFDSGCRVNDSSANMPVPPFFFINANLQHSQSRQKKSAHLVTPSYTKQHVIFIFQEGIVRRVTLQGAALHSFSRSHHRGWCQAVGGSN